MVITLELTPEQEQRVASAEAQGIDVPKLMLNTLNYFPPASKKAERELVAYGKYAHLPYTVEDFMRDKQAEIDLEEEQLMRLGNG